MQSLLLNDVPRASAAAGFVQQMAVDVDQCLAAFQVGNAMLIPKFLEESAGGHAEASTE